MPVLNWLLLEDVGQVPPLQPSYMRVRNSNVPAAASVKVIKPLRKGLNHGLSSAWSFRELRKGRRTKEARGRGWPRCGSAAAHKLRTFVRRSRIFDTEQGGGDDSACRPLFISPCIYIDAELLPCTGGSDRENSFCEPHAILRRRRAR